MRCPSSVPSAITVHCPSPMTSQPSRFFPLNSGTVSAANSGAAASASTQASLILVGLSRQRRRDRGRLAPALVLGGLHVFEQLFRQIRLQLRTARLIREYPAHRRDCLR